MSVDLPVKQVSKKEEEWGNFGKIVWTFPPEQNNIWVMFQCFVWLLTAVGFAGKSHDIG